MSITINHSKKEEKDKMKKIGNYSSPMKQPLVIATNSSGSRMLPDAVCPDGHSPSWKRGEGRDAVCVSTAKSD